MRPSRREGFTLLELLVVIVIIAMAVGVIWPRLPRLASAERSESLRHLAHGARAMYEHSSFKKKTWRSSTTWMNRSTLAVS